MAHHNVLSYPESIIHFTNGLRSPIPYGVPLAMRCISSQALLKKWNRLNSFMSSALGLSPRERLAALHLLRLFTHYGIVYCKASQLPSDEQCSKRTFWRTITKLKEANLIQVVNRYIRREHAQISNVYQLDKLVLALAKYLSETGLNIKAASQRVSQYLSNPTFWRLIYSPKWFILELSPP